MQTRVTEKIKLWGIVQGVGFRPFVAKCADKYGMKGTVLNIGGLVDIVVTDTPKRIDDFVSAIKREKPVPAEIVHIKREILGREGEDDEEFVEFTAFTISFVSSLRNTLDEYTLPILSASLRFIHFDCLLIIPNDVKDVLSLFENSLWHATNKS